MALPEPITDELIRAATATLEKRRQAIDQDGHLETVTLIFNIDARNRELSSVVPRLESRDQWRVASAPRSGNT